MVLPSGTNLERKVFNPRIAKNEVNPMALLFFKGVYGKDEHWVARFHAKDFLKRIHRKEKE